jgi:hypothetical protein
MQHTACSMQHTTCSMQHTTCSMQHTKCNMQHSTCSMNSAAQALTCFVRDCRVGVADSALVHLCESVVDRATLSEAHVPQVLDCQCARACSTRASCGLH